MAGAKALRDLPAVAQAFAAGQLSSAHVAVITGALNHLPGLPDYEQAIAAAAGCTEPGELARMLNVLIGQDNPPHPDTHLNTQRNRRGLGLSEHADGRFRITGWLDPLEGTRLREALDAFTDPPAAGDLRTPTARRADALGDLAATHATRHLARQAIALRLDPTTTATTIAKANNLAAARNPGGVVVAALTRIVTTPGPAPADRIGPAPDSQHPPRFDQLNDYNGGDCESTALP